MQRDLMAASGQHLPDEYQLHPGVLLYGALNLEELAESLQGVQAALRLEEDQAPQSLAIAELFRQTAETMRLNSLAIRELVKQVPKDAAWPHCARWPTEPPT